MTGNPPQPETGLTGSNRSTDPIGSVVQIQSLSVNDGEGIRTTIFLQGCPLRCRWCSNPETWQAYPNTHRVMEVDEVVEKVMRDEVFFRFSKGGVTFSGGEPTFQEEFLRALVHAFDSRGIELSMETCGYFSFDAVSDILAKLSHVFFDIKYMDKEMHKELTGVSNEMILENSIRLHDLGVAMTVRIPLIPGVTAAGHNLEQTAEFMKKFLPNANIELLPYHNLGNEKYRSLGLREFLHEEYVTPTEDEMIQAEQIFKDKGREVVRYR